MLWKFSNVLFWRYDNVLYIPLTGHMVSWSVMCWLWAVVFQRAGAIIPFRNNRWMTHQSHQMVVLVYKLYVHILVEYILYFYTDYCMCNVPYVLVCLNDFNYLLSLKKADNALHLISCSFKFICVILFLVLQKQDCWLLTRYRYCHFLSCILSMMPCSKKLSTVITIQ